VAARPGQGKSSFSLTLATDFAHHGAKVLFLSLEMGEQEVLYRAIAQRGEVILSDILKANQEDLAPLIDQFKKHTKGNFRILHPGSVNIGEIRRLSEGYDVVVVDQLSTVREPQVKGETKVGLYGRITNALKQQAIEKKQLVFLCCQINRQGEEEPKLINLKDSGSIEEDSDKVILLHCQEKMNGDTKVIIGKNRQGQEDIFVTYQFKRHFTKFIQPNGKTNTPYLPV